MLNISFFLRVHGLKFHWAKKGAADWQQVEKLTKRYRGAHFSSSGFIQCASVSESRFIFLIVLLSATHYNCTGNLYDKYCCDGNKPCHFKLMFKVCQSFIQREWWENNGSSKLSPRTGWIPVRRESTPIAIKITSAKMLSSYLDAEWSLNAPFIIKELGGQGVTCIIASTSFKGLLLTVPFPLSVVCVFMVCLMSNSPICSPAWTPSTASVWCGFYLSFSSRVIIALWVTKNEGPERVKTNKLMSKMMYLYLIKQNSWREILLFPQKTRRVWFTEILDSTKSIAPAKR